MRRTRYGLMTLTATLAILVGCATPDTEPADGRTSSAEGSPDPAGVLPVSEAMMVGDRPVRIRGYILVGADKVARLCTGLAGSYPPQCGNPSLIVEGLVTEEIPGRESAQGIVWSGKTTLNGTIAQGVLTVS